MDKDTQADALFALIKITRSISRIIDRTIPLQIDWRDGTSEDWSNQCLVLEDITDASVEKDNQIRTKGRLYAIERGQYPPAKLLRFSYQATRLKDDSDYLAYWKADVTELTCRQAVDELDVTKAIANVAVRLDTAYNNAKEKYEQLKEKHEVMRRLKHWVDTGTYKIMRA